uniref:Zinc finger containing ubiquitin peptidase 1 n=1 Tax=Eptatretus burgeri TaxID=7764 RepID=A0A8C4R3Z3_EPTBU
VQANLSGAMNDSCRLCPLCGLSFSDWDILQQHVQLHLDLENGPRQYGLDGSGGFVRQEVMQMEQEVARGTMTPSEFHSHRSHLLESLAEGIDDGATRTDGGPYYRHPTGVRASWIAAETSHYRAGPGDVGWGCGYRNLQMLLSCLARLQQFDFLGGLQVPSLPRLQELVEEAWTKGFDPMGASSLGGRLRNTRAWIGSTEIYALLCAQGVRCRVVDFHVPSGPAGTHPRLLQWVLNHFCSSTVSPTGRVLNQTCRPPLYLQHQGHSRTIVGVEEWRNGGLCLLVFDPSQNCRTLQRVLDLNVQPLRRFAGSLKHKQYQILAVEGVMTREETEACRIASHVFTAQRVP